MSGKRCGSSNAPSAVSEASRSRLISLRLPSASRAMTERPRRSSSLWHAAAVMEQQRLFLDGRLEREGAGPAGRWHADLDLVGIEHAVLRAGSPKPADSLMRAGSPTAPLAGPQGRLHAALGRQFARQGAGGGRLQQLQRAIEIGLADAVGADEHRQPPRREADRAQGAVAGGVDLADDHAARLSYPSGCNQPGGYALCDHTGGAHGQCECAPFRRSARWPGAPSAAAARRGTWLRRTCSAARSCRRPAPRRDRAARRGSPRAAGRACRHAPSRPAGRGCRDGAARRPSARRRPARPACRHTSRRCGRRPRPRRRYRG